MHLIHPAAITLPSTVQIAIPVPAEPCLPTNNGTTQMTSPTRQASE